jgi:hypothetical protein
MTETVKMSFEGAYEDPSPQVTVHNPQVMSPALLSQVLRFGLVAATAKRPVVSGKLKGSRKALMEMIQSYGIGVEVVPATYE